MYINMNSITTKDMMDLQNNYYNITAENIVPTLLKYVNENELGENEKKYLRKNKAFEVGLNYKIHFKTSNWQ